MNTNKSLYLDGLTLDNASVTQGNGNLFDKIMHQQKSELLLYRDLACIIGSLLIVSNFIVVVSSGLILRKAGSRSKSTFLLLGNVSLADTLIGINIIIVNIGSHNVYSDSMCAFLIGLIVTPTLVSVISVGLIAVDRYIYILHGLYYHRWINTTRVRISIIFSWLLGIALGFMPATGWAEDSLEGRKCWYLAVAPPGLITLIALIGFLPVSLVWILYSIVLYRALKKVQQLQATDNSKNKESDLRINRGKVDNVEKYTKYTISTISDNIESRLQAGSRESKVPEDSKHQSPIKKRKNLEPSKWRAIKVVLLTTGSLMCTWVPYFIATIMYILCDKETEEERCLTIEQALTRPLANLALLNSFFNPLIYAWWHKGFNAAVRKLFGEFRNTFLRFIKFLKSCINS